MTKNDSSMDNLNKKYRYLDLLGLLSLGVISLGYILFVKRLAERYIQFPFLNFPIFVGEILLFICLLLFLAKYIKNPQRFTKWHCLILFYFIFVIIKALHGYIHWGPLALRHAALLYYPVFAVFGYAFYRKDFLDETKSLILFLLICTAFITKYHDYWTLTLMLSGLILIKSYPNKTIRPLMFLTLLVIIPYKVLFCTSRMMIVSNFLSGLYLAGTLPVILKVKRNIKFALMALMGGVVILGLFKFADQGAVKSIVAFKKMVEVIRSSDAYIEANANRFKMDERKEVKLYNPDKFAENDSETQRHLKAELKQIVVNHVKEKVMDFSFKQINEKTQKIVAQEVRQEMESILEKQLLAEKPHPPVRPVKTEAPQVQDEAQENDVEESKIKVRQILLEQAEREIQTAPVAQITGDDEKRLDPLLIDDVKREVQTVLTKEFKRNIPAISEEKNDTGWVDNGNAVFRLLVWRDMWRDFKKELPIFGFSFGKPFRSKSLEILNWGTGDWARDGWIEPHNSYFHMIYRAGIIGILFIVGVLFVLLKMIKYSILAKSLTGILLCGIIINWSIAANFLVIFEVPYTAIPIWTIYGMTFAYCHKIRERA